jgi:hypothetical protein
VQRRFLLAPLTRKDFPSGSGNRFMQVPQGRLLNDFLSPFSNVAANDAGCSLEIFCVALIAAFRQPCSSTFYELTSSRRLHYSKVKDASWPHWKCTYRTKRGNLVIATIGSPEAERPGIYPIASATNLGTDGRRRLTCHAAPFSSVYACPPEFEARNVHHALVFAGWILLTHLRG